LAGRYEVVEEIGRGGMGIVYRGHDRLLGELIAIKVLHPALELDTRGVERLKEETRIVHRLSHPNIVQIRHFEQDGQTRFVIMELVDGLSLRQMLKQRGRLPLDEALRLAEGICAGLQYAHAQRVIHCDIKPENVLVTSDGTPKIADFGVAKVAHELLGAVTQIATEGTPAFMSPEQLRGEKVDVRANIYSLGVTLYELLTGPEQLSPRDLRNRVMLGLPLGIPDAPSHVNRALSRALAWNPDDRWQTAGDFLQALLSPTAGAPPHAVPRPLTSFFGRDAELGQLERLFLHEGRRLITLRGPGGCGKTRLAVEACARLAPGFEGGAWFVPLEDVGEPQRIADAIMTAAGVPRAPGRLAFEQVVEASAGTRRLLVLDSFEHLVEEGATIVRSLLDRAPGLACLVTSRQSLGLSGERQLTVEPLQTPPPGQPAAQMAHNPSVQLFLDRARCARPTFELAQANAEAVAELCRRLEGIPLAIELAAARAAVMSPVQMVAALEHRLDFLVSGKRDVSERHRTLRATVEWSYQLLSPQLQRFLAALSVFRGGWTLQAAEAVCADPGALDDLSQLRECSLVLTEDAGVETRFRMLDTLREYAAEKVPSEELPALRRRHADHYVQLAERAARAPSAESDEASLHRLEAEQENLRTALEWLGSAPDGAEAALRLAAALGGFWLERGYWDEGRRHLGRALGQEGAQQPTAVRATALSHAAGLASSQGDYAEACKLFEEALAIFRGIGDLKETAATLGYLGNACWRSGDCAAARRFQEEGLDICRTLGDPEGTACALHNLGLLAAAEGDHARAQDLIRQGLDRRKATGDKRGIAESLSDLGLVALEQGDYGAARPLLEESLSLRRESGQEDELAIALHNAAALANLCHEHDRAEPLLRQSLAISRKLGHRPLIAESLAEMATVLWKRGEQARAARLLGATEALRETTGHSRSTAEKNAREQLAGKLRAEMGEEAFREAYEHGRSMSLSQAVDAALGDSP
jgi:non-specific serine/threonine protein kinase